MVFQQTTPPASPAHQKVANHLQVLQAWLTHAEHEASALSAAAHAFPQFGEDLESVKRCLEDARETLERFHAHLQGSPDPLLFDLDEPGASRRIEGDGPSCSTEG